MRYALNFMWLIGFTWLVIGFSAPAQSPPGAVVTQEQSNLGLVTKLSLAPAKSITASATHFTVTGPYQTTREDAWQAALARAQKEVTEHLLRGEGSLAYEPEIDYIRKHLVRTSKEEEKDLEQPVGKVRRIILDISITPQNVVEIAQRDLQRQEEARRHEQAWRSRERMTYAGIILVGLVTVLGAVAGYLRLDELTKGYYTGWLMAAAGLVGAAAVAAVVLFLFAA
jgi:hypothetical protein